MPTKPKIPTSEYLPQQTHTQPPETRRALGKALRKNTPRSAHAGWNPPSDRRDPIDLLIESSQGRLEARPGV